MYSHSQSRYCYPNSDILINNQNIRNLQQLESFERMVSLDRIRLLNIKPLQGDFNLEHLCAIHKFIFKDIYPFAGELREEDIAKGQFRFPPVIFLKNQTEILLSELRRENFFRDLEYNHVVERLAHYLTELNVLHPFREGNGRAQREFIRQLALVAGVSIDYTLVEPVEILNSMIESPYNNQKLISVIHQISSEAK